MKFTWTGCNRKGFLFPIDATLFIVQIVHTKTVFLCFRSYFVTLCRATQFSVLSHCRPLAFLEETVAAEY